MEELIFTFLEHGFLLRVDYVSNDNKEKYVYLMKGKWFNALPLMDRVENEQLIWDVVCNVPFNFNGILIKEVVYDSWPRNADYGSIISQKKNETNKSFATEDEEFADTISLAILEHKLTLQEHLRKNCVESYESFNTEELQDRCTLNFYPTKITINETSFSDLKRDIISDFFTYAAQQVPEENQFQALRMFGVSEQYVDCDDKHLIEALRRQWVRLIEKEKHTFLANVSSVDLSDFTEEEKIEFIEEFGILKTELDSDILNSSNELLTIRNIISFWPEMLQPTPTYVHEN